MFADQNWSKKISAMCDLNYAAFGGGFLSLACCHPNVCGLRNARFGWPVPSKSKKGERKEEEPCFIESPFLPSRRPLSACRAWLPMLQPVVGAEAAVAAVVDQGVPHRASWGVPQAAVQQVSLAAVQQVSRAAVEQRERDTMHPHPIDQGVPHRAFAGVPRPAVQQVSRRIHHRGSWKTALEIPPSHAVARALHPIPRAAVQQLPLAAVEQRERNTLHPHPMTVTLHVDAIPIHPAMPYVGVIPIHAAKKYRPSEGHRVG